MGIYVTHEITRVKSLKGGHVVHMDNPMEFTEAVMEFLQSV
jgi:hypothetical protein